MYRSLPGFRIQRNRDCQPRTALCVSYWMLFTQRDPRAELQLAGKRYSVVLKLPLRQLDMVPLPMR